jgi:hypothetical protein
MQTEEYVKVEGEQIWIACYFCSEKIGFYESSFGTPFMSFVCSKCKTPLFVLPEMSYD